MPLDLTKEELFAVASCLRTFLEEFSHVCAIPESVVDVLLPAAEKMRAEYERMAATDVYNQ